MQRRKIKGMGWRDFYSVTLDLKNNSLHLLLKHCLHESFMITEGRQVIPILESLPSDYQPKTKDGGTSEVATIKRLVAYLVVL